MNDDQRAFVAHLERQVGRYLAVLEEMFGPRDSRFEFGKVRESRSSPRTHFPRGYYTVGGCVVDIHIGAYPWKHCCYDQGTWQVAHECVHLLDPGINGSANNLEEGLATWFQDEVQYHDELVKRYIARNSPHAESYSRAKQVVTECMPELASAMKAIRSSGTKIRDISVDELAARLPNADSDSVERLCAKFGG